MSIRLNQSIIRLNVAWPPIDNCDVHDTITTYADDPSKIFHQREPRFPLLWSLLSIFPLLDAASPLSIASPVQSRKASMS